MYLTRLFLFFAGISRPRFATPRSRVGRRRPGNLDFEIEIHAVPRTHPCSALLSYAFFFHLLSGSHQLLQILGILGALNLSILRPMHLVMKHVYLTWETNHTQSKDLSIRIPQIPRSTPRCFIFCELPWPATDRNQNNTTPRIGEYTQGKKNSWVSRFRMV